MVRTMAGYGVPHDDIALVVHCSPPTLRKRFREELDIATIEANARVAQTLYQQATTPGNIAATIFWLKARAGWREKQVVELTGKDDAAVPAFNVTMYHPVPDEPWPEDAGRQRAPHKSADGQATQIFLPYKREG